jgi:hypothetical protein
MPKPKIDRVKLNQMLMSGKPQKEIAQFFGVSAGAISKAKQELNIEVRRDIAARSAPHVLNRNLNLMDQLTRINTEANRLLDAALDAEDTKTIFESMREIRQQLAFQHELLRSLHDLREVQAFQDEVLDVIAGVSPEMRQQILDNLRRKRDMRAIIDQ